MQALIARISLVLGGVLVLEGQASAVCFGDWQCNDSNPCTYNVCSGGACTYPNRVNGSSCTMSYGEPGSCVAGQCRMLEQCDDGIDQDGDGITDEHVPAADGTTCEGPRGVNETGSWYTSPNAFCSGTGPQIDGPFTNGSNCHYHAQCYSGWCADRASGHAICAPVIVDNCPGTGYSGWGTAWVLLTCSAGADVRRHCVPYNVGWSDPSPSLNQLGVTCRFDSDCASGVCVRANDFGRCGQDATPEGWCPSGTTLRVHDLEGYPYICAPNSVTCTESVDACTCNWDGTWTCP